jgi:DNA-binding CsgD family transcriptional regulator
MEARAAHYRSRPDLTSRQRHILKLMAEGSTNAEIGQKLGITLDGAKWHVSEIIHKLDATSREDAVARWKASQSGLERAGRAARAMVGLLKVPSAYLAAGAVATACVVAVSAALTSFEARDTGPRLATSGSAGVGISLPTLDEVAAVAISDSSFPKEDMLLPLPLDPKTPSDALVIQSILDLLPTSGHVSLDPRQPYIWSSPRLELMLDGGSLVVAGATECVPGPREFGNSTVCVPLVGFVDLLMRRDGLPDTFVRFEDPRLSKWLVDGWQAHFPLGTQAEWNVLWDDRLRTPQAGRP